jgi:hypothetical protein
VQLYAPDGLAGFKVPVIASYARLRLLPPDRRADTRQGDAGTFGTVSGQPVVAASRAALAAQARLQTADFRSLFPMRSKRARE